MRFVFIFQQQDMSRLICPVNLKLATLLVTNFVSNVKLMTCLAYYLPSLQVVVEPSLKRSG